MSGRRWADLRQVRRRAQGFTSTFVDNQPANISQGDEIAVEGMLSKNNGRAAGRIEVHEVLTALTQSGGGRIQLLITALLIHLQISASVSAWQAGGAAEVTEVFTGLPAGGGARVLLTFTATLAAGQNAAMVPAASADLRRSRSRCPSSAVPASIETRAGS